MGISVTLSNTLAKRRATEVIAFIDTEKEQNSQHKARLLNIILQEFHGDDSMPIIFNLILTRKR